MVSQDIFKAVADETRRVIDLNAKRIDIKLKETGDTPRYMSTVSQASIKNDSKLVPAVYESEELKGFLSVSPPRKWWTAPGKARSTS